jgi:hypothetical protein
LYRAKAWGHVIAGLGEFGPRFSAPLRQNQDINSVSSDFVYTKGAHGLKFGFLYNHYNPVFTLGAASIGQLNFPSITDFLRATPNAYTARAPVQFSTAHGASTRSGCMRRTTGASRR